MKKAWHNVTLQDLSPEFNQGNIESNKVKEEHGGPKKCWASLCQHQPTKYPTYGIQQWLGKEGVIVAAAIAGFADTHSAAVAVASLVAAGKLSVNEAVLPILASLTTNTITKIVLAVLSGNWRFISAIIPGLILVILAAWLGAAFALGYF